MLATSSEVATCKLWTADSDKPLETLKGHQGKNVRALCSLYGDDFDLLATGGEDGAIKIWDVSAMKQNFK